MKEQRDRALARAQVKRSEAELTWLMAVLEAGRENLSPKNLEITEDHIEHQTEVIERAHERLQKYMSRDFCVWHPVAFPSDDKHTWKFYYTEDADGDGWYWWQIIKVEGIGTLSGPKQISKEEGKSRKRTYVKRFVQKKCDKRIAQIREAKKETEDV